MNEPVITVIYHRLPDITTYRDLERYPELIHYGRFAILRDGSFWCSTSVQSSHPRNTQVGFYWAIDKDGVVLVSPRGVKADFDILLRDDYRLMIMLSDELERCRLVKF